MLEQTITGITFKNPVGLSAGFDKNGDLINILPDVGFGFQQVGTVTLNAYSGNEQPWTRRLKKSNALVVNYGLKNIGVEAVLKKIKNKRIPLSISVAKTNSIECANIEQGIEDNVKGFNKVVESGVADFITINISCPNVFGGEPFTTPEALEKLLGQISSQKPVFLKMAINLEWNVFEKLCEIAIKHNAAGVIIGNLNKDRSDPAIVEKLPVTVKGNISGKPTQRLSNELISKTYAKFGDKLVIIGVGGIFSAEDAYEKIKRGASLVQLITGMIYEGPQLIGEINMGLVSLLKKDGFKNIAGAIGAFHTK